MTPRSDRAKASGEAQTPARKLLRWWPVLLGLVPLLGWAAAREYVPQIADAQVREQCMDEIGKAKQSCTDAVTVVKRELGAEIKAGEVANTTAHAAIHVEIVEAKVSAGRTDERLEAVQRSLVEMRTEQRQDQQETRQSLQRLLQGRTK